MPQGRSMPQGRHKKPFSGKAKKEQLQNKRASKNPNSIPNSVHVVPTTSESQNEVEEETSKIVSKPQQDKSTALQDVDLRSGMSGRQRYDLIFQRESKEDIQKHRENARKPYKMVDNKELEMESVTVFPDSCNFPRRPGKGLHF